jgi:hypothetical protein
LIIQINSSFFQLSIAILFAQFGHKEAKISAKHYVKVDSEKKLLLVLEHSENAIHLPVLQGCSPYRPQRYACG